MTPQKLSTTVLLLAAALFVVALPAAAQLPAPVLVSPGSGSAPGPTISDTTPTFQWQSVSGATKYGLYVSRNTGGGSYQLVFDSEYDYGGSITGTSFTLPAGYLSSGNEYRWNMRAYSSVSGWGSFSGRLYFTVSTLSPPGAPNLISPGSGSAPGPTISDTTPTFQWQSVSGATEYGLYVSRNTGGGSYQLVFDSEYDYGGTITGTSFTLPSGYLASGNEYRWNMRARNAAGWGSFSGRLYFAVSTLSPPGAPTLISPGSGSAPGPTIGDTTPTFQWQSVSGATEYGLYVSRNTGGGSYLVLFDSESDYGGTLAGTSLTLPSGYLSSGNEYRWNMRARNAAGWGSFSGRLYFTVSTLSPPGAPNLISPGSGSAPGPTIADTTPTFQWQSVSGATEYGLYVSRNTGGGSYLVVFDSESDYGGTLAGTSLTLPTGYLASGNEYRWNMRARNAAGWGSFSGRLYFAVETVSTPAAPPTLTSPGTPSSPGSVVPTLTPTFQWQSVSEAAGYGLYISRYKCDNNHPLIYDSEAATGVPLTGSSLTLPIGYLDPGLVYRWNMNSYNAAGWGDPSEVLYFTTSCGTIPEPAVADSFRMPISSNGDDLSRLSIDAFPGGYPKIVFDGEWYVATAHNRNRWLSDFLSGTTACYADDNGDGVCEDFHPGEDWNRLDGQDQGETVYAIANGVTAYSGYVNNYGNTVILVHRLPSNELVASFYAHLDSAPWVNCGDTVAKGDPIGYVGNSGSGSFSPHLHFEIRSESMIETDSLVSSFDPDVWPASCFPDGYGSTFIGQNYYEPSPFLLSASGPEIFSDGFESGNMSAWTSNSP